MPKIARLTEDRVQYQEDRELTQRLIADSDYLTREIAALRIAMGEVATRDYLRSELKALLEEFNELIKGEEESPEDQSKN